MKAIVLGGSGFVGSHVADALSNAGHEVSVFDRRPSLHIREDQKFIKGNLLSRTEVTSAIEGMDLVYHFAGIADIDQALTKPIETVESNVLGCVHVLDAAREAEAKRFIFASTIYVYSNSGGFYRVSKQACELYIEEYSQRYGLDYTILRYGTLYGTRADEKNSVFRYLKEAFSKGKISASGTGEEMREYINVEDAAKMSVQILEPEFANQSIILTGQNPMRYRDLLALISEIVDRDVEIEFKPPSKEDMAHYKYTPYKYVPKAGKKLVSNYYTDLGQGLLECLEDIYKEGLAGDK